MQRDNELVPQRQRDAQQVSCAMQRRLSMEQLSAFIIGGSEPLPEAV